MDWYRDGSRQRSRILYVFRTPGGTRVGRSALEPEIRREIEATHSDIEFDWDTVVASQQVVEPPTEVRRPRKRRKAPGEEESDVGERQRPEAQPPAEAKPAGQSRASIPSMIEGATPDEQAAFLGRWYAIIKARIPQRTNDPSRQQALMALAERLNPAPWTDADDTTAGLENAAEALARLSRVFARRRRRARRGSGAAGRGSEGSGRAPESAKPSEPEGSKRPSSET
jgi:hypothetical protein